jgi:hypothetical protein
MSVNKDRQHVLVLPEDDANRQLANGFRLGVDSTRLRQIQVLLVAGGWRNVLSLFQSEYIAGMERYPNRFMVLLIDFDDNENRLTDAKAFIPEHLADRVFILGTLSKPEALRAALGPYETIGLEMAKDCRDDTNIIWEHDLLRHNASELDRLRQHVRPILFQPT